jgi:uncharacterized damage-inducible protein DinB
MASVTETFTRFAAIKMRQLLHRIEVCVEKLDDDQLWLRREANSNAIGNLCLHLNGNVRQWILHGVAGQPDMRKRDEEFAARGGIERAELMALLRGTVEEACAVIESLEEEDLLRIVRPQNYEVCAMEAVFHVVEHFAQHTGQIIFAMKVMTGEDPGFYRHLSGTSNPPPPPASEAMP